MPLNLGAAARAYGVARPAPVRPSAAPNQTPDAPTSGTAPKTVNGLVAGAVRVPADPANAPATTPQAAFAMYTRAADRIEAAVQVAVGRTIDVRG
ncbi:MAG: hypothetical protein JNM94_04900 [Phycisphaerae bacterium]|nr:hypothetical protein [Phycisphaerae bacterium]